MVKDEKEELDTEGPGIYASIHEDEKEE